MGVLRGVESRSREVERTRVVRWKAWDCRREISWSATRRDMSSSIETWNRVAAVASGSDSSDCGDGCGDGTDSSFAGFGREDCNGDDSS